VGESGHHGGAPLTPADCWRILGQNGLTVWFTGRTGSAGSTLVEAIGRLLLERGLVSHRLAGTDEGSRDTAGRVAQLLASAGVIALVSLESPREIDRVRARELHRETGIEFLEIPDGSPEAAEQVVAQIVSVARPDARAA
jgi:adenylylsulfate kinase-like enzyme